MLADKHASRTPNRSNRSARANFDAVATFEPMSVDELIFVHRKLEKILSRKIAAETAQLKKKLAKLTD
jgi:hypothetical protein